MTPALRFLLGWAGVKRLGPDILSLSDGTEFHLYPMSKLMLDWDAIRNGQRDVTGQLWAKFNDGKPCWNAKDWSYKVTESAKDQRLRDYSGKLRSDVNNWPEIYKRIYKDAHP